MRFRFIATCAILPLQCLAALVAVGQQEVLAAGSEIVIVVCPS
jgi:hypothetical protein